MNNEHHDFYCYDSTFNYRRDQFPEGAGGIEEWNRVIAHLPNVNEGEPIREQIENFQRAARRSPRQPLSCPRLFISHRQSDSKYALRIADRACHVGFYYWLDVLDPSLRALGVSGSGNQAQKALATALIIEMALLNCSHLLAVMTDNTAGTMWVPYEYGRVKDLAPISVNPSAWLHVERSTPTVPEYMLLGVQHHSECEIDNWLADELKKWLTPTGKIASLCAARKFQHGPTMPLP